MNYSSVVDNIAPKYKQEVFDRVSASCKKQIAELSKRVEKYTALQEMYIQNRKNLPNSYDVGDFMKELNSATFQLNKFKTENAEFLLV